MTTLLERIASTLVLLVGVAAAGGCSSTSSGCTQQMVSSFVVYVEDAKSGASICDATLTSNDGSKTETLTTSGPPDCSYGGIYDRSGTFHISASKSGYQQAATTVLVKSGTCHVVTQDVTLELSPL